MKFISSKWMWLSILFNIGVLFIGARHYYILHRQNQEIPNNGWPDLWNKERVEIYKMCPIDTGDIVFIGNSLTEAFPVAEIFPHKHIKNRGIGGNKTSHLLSRITPILDCHPRQLFVEIGINDLWNGIPEDSAFEHYKTLINIINSRKIPLYIQSLFPTCGEYTRVNPEIIYFNQRLKNYCLLKKVEYIDIYPFLCKNGVLDSALTYDGLHLNSAGYKIWKEKIKRFIN